VPSGKGNWRQAFFLGSLLGALLLRLVGTQPQVRIHPGVRVGGVPTDVGADVDDRVLGRPRPGVEVRGVAGLLAVAADATCSARGPLPIWRVVLEAAKS
jgi:hypothetical protein